MASKLSREEVLRVAALARLELTESEIALFTRQIADILTHAESLSGADTAGIPPTSHPFAAETAWREDVPAPSIDRSDAIGEAPQGDRLAGLFKVPKVL